MMIGDTLQAITLLLLPFVLRDLVNAVEGYDASLGVSIWEVIEKPFFEFVLVNIALVIFARMSGTFLAFLAPFYSLKPRLRLIEHMQNHAFNFFQNRHSGALGNKIHQSIIGLRMGLWTFAFII